jgi:murein DD-endopeptidase MepM/ murein hydrolase activator NlpD
MATASATKIFEVVKGPLKVRAEPGGQWIKDINAGAILEVEAGSRREFNGMIWWKHNEGWSAQGNTHGSEVFLREVTNTLAGNPGKVSMAAPPVEVQQVPAVSIPVTETSASSAQPVKKVFQVLSFPVKIRATPSLSSPEIRLLSTGSTVEVDPESRTEAEGYIWWKHSEGWSAEKKADDSQTLMSLVATVNEAVVTTGAGTAEEPTKKTATITVEVPAMTTGEQTFNVTVTSSAEQGVNVQVTPNYPNYVDAVDVNKLPLLNGLFTRLPVDLKDTQWAQYYGNTQFAFENGTNWGYDKYFQCLHSGLDFGNSNAAVKVYAGVQGTFEKYFNAPGPNAIFVKSGDYTIIYGHLINPAKFEPGAEIKPDDVLGETEPKQLMHLHLEVRYRDKWIVNPLILIAADLRDAFMNKTRHNQTFCTANGFSQWQSPFDQPVIEFQGKAIGPHAR